MFHIIRAVFCFLAIVPAVYLQEQADHRDFQYNTIIDPQTGRYNFAYDTGNDNDADVAHSLHMQYQDADGIVRGRYGYTDPRGKLRIVEYEAGPDGFVARGDVGPDLFPHGEAPAPTSGDSQPRLSSYRADDLDLDPAPIQMAGWDPAADPMNQVQPAGGGYPSLESSTDMESENSNGNEAAGFEQPQYTTLNITSDNALEVYGPELGFYTDRYPRVSYVSGNVDTIEPQSTSSPNTAGENEVANIQENNALNINNIDVDPDDIREASGSPVRRSADGNPVSIVRRSGVQQQATGTRSVRVPYSYRNYARYYHDHDAETRSRQTHDHDAETRSRQAHDHDAERRWYLSRQTHDHDAERKWYPSRQTYNHDTGRRWYPSRQTHDHDAEKNRNHDHEAERIAYYRRLYAQRNSYYPRRIFYRDSHSMEPHEHHDNPVYRNYRDHQHSDVQLYGRSRNYVYPATAKPHQLKYIPADKYHDKIYYRTYE